LVNTAERQSVGGRFVVNSLFLLLLLLSLRNLRNLNHSLNVSGNVKIKPCIRLSSSKTDAITKKMHLKAFATVFCMFTSTFAVNIDGLQNLTDTTSINDIDELDEGIFGALLEQWTINNR
jgi:hypothetical protein